MDQVYYETVKAKAVGNLVEICITGKLKKDDYALFLPVVEQAIERCGKVRMIVLLKDFHGWTAGALWEDIKFDLKHFNHIERLAIAGETAWEKGMAVFCKPFTTAKVKYFDIDDLGQAEAWVVEE